MNYAYGYSSTSSTTSSTTTLSGYMIMQMQIALAAEVSTCFFASALSILGIGFNLIVVIVMPMSKGLSRKVKMFYIVIAVSEVLFLLFNNIISTFIDNGLRSCPLGAISKYTVYWKTVAPWFCQVNRAVSEASEGYAGWTLAVFSLERCVVVNFPMKASWFTYRRSVYLIIGVTVYCYGLGSLDFYLYKPAGTSCGVNSQEPAAMIATVQSYILMFLPVFLLPILAILTIIGIVRNRETNLAKSRQKNTSELRMTVILLFLATLHFVFRGGAPLTWVLFRALRMGVLSDLSDFFEGVAGFVYCLNFMVYVCLMKPFRMALKDLFCCTFLPSRKI